MAQISSHLFKSALLKNVEFQKMLSTFEERMKTFECYYNAVQISFQITSKITLFGKNTRWDKETSYTTDKRCYQLKNTIICDFDFTQTPKASLANIIAQTFASMFPKPKEFKVMRIEMEIPWCHIERLMAWANEVVGLYYIEQECGEGWIKLPIKPNNNVFDNSVINLKALECY